MQESKAKQDRVSDPVLLFAVNIYEDVQICYGIKDFVIQCQNLLLVNAAGPGAQQGKSKVKKKDTKRPGPIGMGPGGRGEKGRKFYPVLLEVPLQQTLQSLAVTSLVACHLMHGALAALAGRYASYISSATVFPLLNTDTGCPKMQEKIP